MAMAQATSTSWLYRSVVHISRPVVPLKIRGNAANYSSSTRSARIVSSLQDPSMENSSTSPQEIVRPLENFYPDMWVDRFITLPFSNSEFEYISTQVETMKETVKDMLMTSTMDPIKNIYLINSLSRLGISYHFENEIEQQLDHLFLTLPQFMDNKDYDLYTVGIIFQVFRSHGYKISCDAFKKFKNDDGMFKEELSSNIKDIISLYEASHWGVHGELILDEALAFTTLHLGSLVRQSFPDHLKEYIATTLDRPYHKGMPRLEARQYISFYEKDHESRNDILLNFAKYDFNRVQMHLQQELSLLSSWWEKSKLGSRFPYIRQRIMETFVVLVGGLFEPRFALSRNLASKWLIAYLLLDDTYDAYGLFEELQYFTKAFQRFDDINAIDELPMDYLKNLYEAVLNISDEVEEEVSKQGRSFTVFYIKEGVKKLVRLYILQARWAHERILPAFDEYLETAIESMGMDITMGPAMMVMDEADEDAYQWLKTNSDAKILRAMNAITRLYNDLQTNEDEEKRGGQVSGIACYMKEYGVSKKEAIEGYKELIRVSWKDLNEGLMERPKPVARKILMMAFNIAGTADVFYRDDNGFNKPEITFNQQIKKLLIDPIPIHDLQE